MESFLVDLKKDVQCFLCNDTLTEPKILPCFHTFCKPCIKRHTELIYEVNVLKCPRCKSQTSLPEPSSIEGLQPSLLHSRILKGLAMAEGQKVCSVSERHSSAYWYCFDCDRSMCDECQKYHTEFIKDHKVVRLDELKKEDIESIIAKENPCTSHPHHRLELFCEDCGGMICLSCLKHDHKDHKTMSLDKLAGIKKAVLSKHLKTLEQLRIDTKEKQQQKHVANTIQQQGEKAKHEVKEKTKKMIQLLRDSERELLRQINEKLNTAARNLNIIRHIPAAKEYINNVMERGLASEMINIQETQCSEKFIFNPIPLSSGIVFVSNQDLVQQVNTGLGEIETCLETDHTKSTVLVEGKPDLEAARQQKLIIITKTSEGLDSINTGDVVEVHIRPEDDVEIEKEDVRTGGRIEVEFMAKIAGQLTAEVQVNGNPVSNSPLVINAKPQNIRVTGQFNMIGVNTGPHKLAGIAVNRDNSRIAVANVSSLCVCVFNIDGELLLTYGSQGSTQGQLSYPEGLAFLNDIDLVITYVNNDRICIVNTTTGKLVKTFGSHGNSNEQFNHPCGVHIDDNGNIIVCDRDNQRVQVFTREGNYQYQFGLTTQDEFNPVDVTAHGSLFYVSDYYNHVIQVFEKKGDVPTRISTIGGYGSADGQLNNPLGLAIDKDNHLLVCDRGNNRVQKFTLDGLVVGKSGSLDEIKDPVYLTVLNDGKLLVTSYVTGMVFCLR